GVSTGILGDAVAALTGPFGIATAAIVGLGLAANKALSSMTEQAESIRKLQAVTGLGVEATDNLADTFSILGADAQTLTNALFKMSQEVEAGGANLRRMGVEVRDSQGWFKASGDILLEVRDRISQMGSEAERNAALMQVFGRS